MKDDIGKLILRVALGGSILLHGIAKLSGGVSGIEGMLTANGLPAFLAYGAYIGEVVAPLLVIAGWYSRVGGALIAINMLFALGLAHQAELLTLNQSGGWSLELQGMFLFAAVAVAFFGPGRFSVNSR